LEKGKRILGMLLICLSVAALFSWEKWGRDRFIYEDICVLSKDVGRGVVITEEMLDTIRVERRSKDIMGPEDARWLTGRESGQFIKGGMPLFKEYFKAPGLAADESLDRHVLSIPATWIDSCPLTMTRGDRAYFYTGGSLITDLSVSKVSDDEGFEVVATRKQAEALGRIASSGRKFVITYN
jgi:hypothetical protein